MVWLEKLRAAWRARKYSLLISLLVTLLGVGLYLHTYLVEAQGTLAQFITSIEVKTYDTRFRFRGRIEPAPEILIVAIDQKTLDELGSWPFSRLHYVRMLDSLMADGAAVVGFDVSFPKPDEKSALQAIQRARENYLESTPPARRDPRYLAHLEEMEQQADTDARFAEALSRAGDGRVVLGQFFFMNREEVSHVDPETQQEYEDTLAFGAYPQVRPLPSPDGATPPPLSEIFALQGGLEGYLPQPNLQQFADAVNYNFGYFDFIPESDGIYRRTNLVLQHKQDFYPSLDVQLLRHYLDVPDADMGLFYNRAGVEYIQFGDLKVPSDPAGRMLIHFQGPAFTYPHISMSDVAAGNFVPGTFTGKMVLVGATAKGVFDVRPVPVQETGYPGVEIHANVLDTMLNRRFIRRGTREELFDLAFILLFGLVLGGVLAAVPPSWTPPVALATLAGFLLLNYLALAHYLVWLNLLIPGGVLVVNFASVTAFRFLLEEREKRRMRGAFKQYVPPGLIRELMKNPEALKLGGQERELTIMFSDIRGFTALSENVTPLELTQFLNAYTDEMTEIIFKHWGTLDKFEGDAIMAFWGAPFDQDDHVQRACAGVLEMSRRVDELRQQWRAEGKPDINIGVGLNTGRVVVGNMGSRKRFNYTVLGDSVNLASRLEGASKEYASRIIVSEFTHAQASRSVEILQQRLCRFFKLPPEELAQPDGSPAVKRARHLVLYYCHTQALPLPPAFTSHWGEDTDAVARVVAQSEEWLARDKKLRRLIEAARESLCLFHFRPLDWIRVKGKLKPVAIYQLLGLGQNEPYAELVRLSEAGLDAYHNREWQRARETFETILEKHPNDGPAQLFSHRCRKYELNPPAPDWDGVFVMKSK